MWSAADPSSPYFCHGPTLVSFSGGRTSAYMLYQVLCAHGGVLPDDVHVCFANTGKEREPTLRFVHDCATNWGVRVRWLEFVSARRKVPVAERFVEVGYNSASRRGEPFDRLLSGKTGMLPTGRARFCTEFLKVKVFFDFAESIGFGKPGQFAETIGLRADEKQRIDSMRHDPRNEASRLSFPLSITGVRKSDVLGFWAVQPFDLQLPRGLGNCDHCPLIGERERVARAQYDPAGTEWWARHERASGYRFGRTLTFVELLGLAIASPRLQLDDAYEAECGSWCGGMVR